MTTLITRWQAQAPRFLSLLRIVAAWIFLISGTMKFFGWPMPMPDGAPAVLFPNQLWWAGFLETVGGSLLLLGLFSRPAAFILSGEMAVAYWQFNYANHPLFPIMSLSGVPTAAFCFIWLYISAAGPGPWSLDTLLRKVR
ncbi:MAG TPA: DoxX family protein [Gemmatimonadales bacterium]|jgi:putative oxidoreductase|nr:DoxX family protein [Gemmatimonadales bacterium]